MSGFLILLGSIMLVSGALLWVLLAKRYAYFLPLKLGKQGKESGIDGSDDFRDAEKLDKVLKESQKRLKRILHTLPIGIALLKYDGTILLSNKAFKQMLVSISGDRNCRIQSIWEMPAEAKDALAEKLNRLLNQRLHFDQEEGVQTTDGSRKYYRFRAYAINERDMEQPNFVFMAGDVTDRKLAEEAFLAQERRYRSEILAAKEQAESSDKLKSAFLSNMSHEIRTPLNGILGFADLMENPDLNPEERKKYSRIIRHSSESLLAIINDIIDISRIEAGHISISKSPFQLREFLEDVFHFFDKEMERVEKGHIALHLAYPAELSSYILVTDLGRLRQIMNNLIGNAIKFTESGSVTFGCKPHGDDFLEFFVRDTGQGIPDDQQNIIFERFRQADNTISRKHGGTGLGLSISQGLVGLLGGEMYLESSLGKGSEFCFTIPSQSGE